MHSTFDSDHPRSLSRLGLAVRSFADAVAAECVFVAEVSAGETRCIACHPAELRARVDTLLAEPPLGVGDDEVLCRPIRAAEGGLLGWVGVVPGDATADRATVHSLLTLVVQLAAMELARGAGRRRRGS